MRLPALATRRPLNAFDFIVTVALGSTLATVLLSKDLALAEDVVAFALLVLLQFAVTWSAVRSRTMRHLVKGERRCFIWMGVFCTMPCAESALPWKKSRQR